MSILDSIIAKKREHVEAQKRIKPRFEDFELHHKSCRPFRKALQGLRPRSTDGDIRIIAELKPRSPSKGRFNWHGQPQRQAKDYAAGGARAMSVLTDAHFDGNIQLLQEVRNCVELPILRKDFIIDSYQLHETKALPADALLLIAKALPGQQLAEFIAQTEALELDYLVEIVDEQELARALDANANLIGINNRDLVEFTVDIQRSVRLLPLIPDEVVVVSESGVRSAKDIQTLKQAGVDGFLIGETLMQSSNPKQLLAQLIQ